METQVRGNGKGRHKPIVMPAKVPEETPRERFLRIGNARMTRLLDHIRLLGNLSNSNYEWIEQDLTIMQSAIVDELSKTLARFRKRTSSSPQTFSFELDEV